MNPKISLWALAAILIPAASLATQPGGIESSYHGNLGLGTGLGMLEKWCALPNFSFEQQGGIDGWTAQSCNNCHIGAKWNPTKPYANCDTCHLEIGEADLGQPPPPTPNRCLTCHLKDTAKRGDLFTAGEDAHIALGMVCQDCHLKVSDKNSDHQFLKGTALDTTVATMQGTLSCMTCHTDRPHVGGAGRAKRLNQHAEKVACETCHTGLRPAPALASRKWNEFTATGKPVTMKRAEEWLPAHKWYDNTGPGASGGFHLPILTSTERRDEVGAKIYPFNPVNVVWFVKGPDSAFDDVIIVPEVKAADADGDRIVTVEEMRVSYPEATLVTADMNFSITHSVVPAGEAFRCRDCHGRHGWVLDWQELGYPRDPKGNPLTSQSRQSPRNSSFQLDS